MVFLAKCDHGLCGGLGQYSPSHPPRVPRPSCVNLALGCQNHVGCVCSCGACVFVPQALGRSGSVLALPERSTSTIGFPSVVPAKTQRWDAPGGDSSGGHSRSPVHEDGEEGHSSLPSSQSAPTLVPPKTPSTSCTGLRCSLHQLPLSVKELKRKWSRRAC